MIADVLIGLVALVGLGATIGLLAWAYLREDNDDADTAADPEAGPGVLVPDVRLCLSDQGRLSAALDEPALPSRELREVADDGWADELRAIGEAAAADELELHPIWDPAAICPMVAAAGMSLEDWDRCYKTSNRRYWAGRRLAWKTECKDWWEDYRAWREQMELAA